MVQSEGLLIGELAKLAGVMQRTIRHYEQLGLIPAATRGANGYRRYDSTALLELAEIRRLRSVGLSVTDIATLRQAGPRLAHDPELIERLALLDDAIGGEIARLHSRRAALREIRQRVESGDAILTAPSPSSFDSVEELLHHGGASPAAIDEERRVWAAIKAFELPDQWRSVIESGLAKLAEQAELLEAVAETLEVIASIRHLETDDPRVDEAAHRLLEIARLHQADSPLELLHDPLIAPILHALASCFTAAQQTAIATMVLSLLEAAPQERDAATADNADQVMPA